MRRLFPLVLFILTAISAKSQDIPSVHLTKYYYRFPQTPELKQSLNPFDVDQFLWNSGHVYIDSHTWVMEPQNGYDTISNVTKTYSSGSFYAARGEVTNREYRDFINANTGPALYPDTMVWPSDALEENPYQHYYFQHKAYDAYPVLGVSHWQAEKFCEWKEQELNKEMRAKGIKDFNVKVSLPTEAEWENLYYSRVHHWFGAHQDEAFHLGVTPTYLNFIYGQNGYRCNFGIVQSYRLQNLKTLLRMAYAYNTAPKAVNSGEFAEMGYTFHILGNAAEWTATPATGALYNNLEYLLTMSDKIIPNNQTRIDSTQLSKRLHTEKDLAQHFVVKGGSWKDDIFYLQPAAVRLEHAGTKTNDIGFRYIVRVYEIPRGK